MRSLLSFVFRIIEILLSPLTLIVAAWSRIITQAGFSRAVISEKIFMLFGVLPVRDYYTQPLINPAKHLDKNLEDDRDLPGINFNVAQQLQLLSQFKYNEELLKFPLHDPKGPDRKYYYNNNSYTAGDAEFLYNIIRHLKPSRMIEIGSGNSTLIAIEAIDKNVSEGARRTEHICIEPYMQPWLEKTNAKIIREKVETIGASFFDVLEKDDILFIDSSHIIRPQGDVLIEYLEILPRLKPGVIVHVHDIFSPRDYLRSWIYKEHLLWNEQYLLEAFLTMNKDFEVIGALNFLSRKHRDKFSAVHPVFAKQPEAQPGSFWIRRK